VNKQVDAKNAQLQDLTKQQAVENKKVEDTKKQQAEETAKLQDLQKQVNDSTKKAEEENKKLAEVNKQVDAKNSQLKNVKFEVKKEEEKLAELRRQFGEEVSQLKDIQQKKQDELNTSALSTDEYSVVDVDSPEFRQSADEAADDTSVVSNSNNLPTSGSAPVATARKKSIVKSPTANPYPMTPQLKDYVARVDDYIRNLEDFHSPRYHYNIDLLLKTLPPPKNLKIKNRQDFIKFLRSYNELFKVSSDQKTFELLTYTPWRTANERVYGYFHCVQYFCEARWESVNTYCDHWQLCPCCKKSNVYPYRQRKLIPGDRDISWEECRGRQNNSQLPVYEDDNGDSMTSASVEEIDQTSESGIQSATQLAKDELMKDDE
jgi:hypothetical protein